MKKDLRFILTLTGFVLENEPKKLSSVNRYLRLSFASLTPLMMRSS